MTTYLITGANRGIGLEYCHQLNARGDNVIAICRSSSKELDALGVRVVSGIDVSREEAAWRLHDELGGQSIDVLILNAGMA